MKHMFLYDCFMVYHHFSLHDTGWCISHFWTNPNLIHEITFLSLGKLPSNDDSVGMRPDGHYPTHSSLGPRCKQSKRQPQTPWCSKALREGFHDRFGEKERCLEPRAPKATLVGASTISTVKFQNSKRSLTTFGRGKNTLYLIWSTQNFNLCLRGGLGWWFGSLGIDGFVNLEKTKNIKPCKQWNRWK